MNSRWEKYLYKDKHGRIYLNMNCDIMIAILNQMDEAYIQQDSTHNNHACVFPEEIFEDYQDMLQHFCLPCLPDQLLFGLTSTRIKPLYNPLLMNSLHSILKENFKCQNDNAICRLTPIFQGEASSKSTIHRHWYNSSMQIEVANDSDGILCILQGDDGTLVGGIGRSSSNGCVFDLKGNSFHSYESPKWGYGKTKLKFESTLDSVPPIKLHVDTQIKESSFQSPSKSSTFDWMVLEVYSVKFEEAILMEESSVSNTRIVNDFLFGEIITTAQQTHQKTVDIVSQEEGGNKQMLLLETMLQEAVDLSTYDNAKPSTMADIKQHMNRSMKKELLELQVCRDWLCTEEKQLLLEVLFVEQYLFNQYEAMTGSRLPGDQSKAEGRKTTNMLVKEVDAVIKASGMQGDLIRTRIEESCHRIEATFPVYDSNMMMEEEADRKNLLLSFNVRGERLCLFKHSLLSVFPACQLTIRCASGQWQMQADEVDEEGNVYVNHVSGRLFRKLIEFIRNISIQKQQRKEALLPLLPPYSMEVLAEEVHRMKVMLDYLNIVVGQDVVLKA